MSEKKPEVTIFSVLKSAAAALAGIQSNENRERDFNSGKFWHFFIAGGVVTALFIGGVWLAVTYLMSVG